MLQGYDPNIKKFLFQGFTSGFNIELSMPIKGLVVHSNHQSISRNLEKAGEMIEKELSEGRVEGPFKNPPFKHFVCSPLGIRAKKEPGKFRLIHDLSYPKHSHSSINASIPKDQCTVKYLLLDHVIELLQNNGQGALMAKTDIKEAFRLVPMAPQAYHLLGFQFQGNFYYDKMLPMGLSTSCAIFEKFSSALQWIMQSRYGATSVSHILDDFIFISPKHTTCQSHLQTFIQLCADLGVPIKHSKTVFPTTQMEAHGVLLDSVQMQARLPSDKIKQCQDLLTTFATKKRCTLKELQSLIGTLQFACKVIRPGRAFLRRIINLTKGASLPHHHIRLNQEARADIQCWLQFIKHYNGVSVFLHSQWLTSESIKLYSDAAGAKGYAIVYGTKWLANTFPPSWDAFHITIKELYPIVLALIIFGHTLKNRKVLFITDNEACVHIINTQTSRDNYIMKLVRKLVLCSLTHNIHFRARHIPGKHNVIPDLLSRSQFQKARKLAPWLDSLPTPTPEECMPSQMLP